MVKTQMKNRGFTMIELLIVIAIIGILAVFALAMFNPSIKKANDAKRKEDFSSLEKALYSYSLDKSGFPDSLADLSTSGYWPGLLPSDPLEKTDYDNNLGGLVPSDYEVADANGVSNAAFRLWTNLQVTTDPDGVGGIYYRCGGNFPPVSEWSGTCQ